MSQVVTSDAAVPAFEPGPNRAHLSSWTEVWCVCTSPEFCEVHGYHIARQRSRLRLDPLQEYTYASGEPLDPDAWYWKMACECGYEFKETDRKQRLCFPVLRLDDGREVIYRDAPEGTTWDESLLNLDPE